MEITRGSLAKELIHSGFLDEFMSLALDDQANLVLAASDEELVKTRNQYQGAEIFSRLLKLKIEEFMIQENPHLRSRHIDP